MENSTWLGRVAERIRCWCSALDDAVFKQSDLDATARGWKVRRDRPFTRTYRDPRWDSITTCPHCGGAGTCGARTCKECDARGTIRIASSDPVQPTVRQETRPAPRGSVSGVPRADSTPRRETGPQGRRPEGPYGRRARPAPARRRR
jgi:hypothetical protein